MGKDHIKRLNAPKTWQILRKDSKYVIKPVPGPHKLELAMPLGVILKETLNQASTTKEVKKILLSGEIKIDGVTRKDFRFPVGIFDTIDLANSNEHFRVVLNQKGHISLIKINKEEASFKPCKIMGKTMVNGKLQLNLYDGKSIIVDKNAYKVGDTIMLSLPDHKISKHLKLEKKSSIMLTGGRHIGEIGNVDDVIEKKVIYKDEKSNLVQTSKEYAFVVGENKPLIRLG